MNWKPHNYQLDAVRFLLTHGSAGLFAFPGSGKTSVTLAALKILIEQKVASKVLLIAPMRVCYNVWPKEMEKWEEFHSITGTVLHGPKKLEALKEDVNIYIINPEGLQWLLSQKNLPRFDTLVLDELSKFKHTQTKRFKLLKPVLPKFSRRWGLTGSPASNGLLDLFGQIYVLDLGRSLGPYITRYRMKYFFPEDFMGYKWNLKEGADKEIHDRIRPLVMILQADDSGLDLPDLVENIIEVALPNEAMQAYRAMEAVLVAQIREQTVTAANAAAASVKCRQIVNGGVYHDQEVGKDRGVQEIHTTKVEALKDLVEELQGEPLLVAYQFDHDLERIKGVLGRDTPHIGGGVPAKRAEDIITKWNAGDIPVLLAHPATLAHGVNIQDAGSHLVWFAPTWDFEHHDQFIRRIWRQGQKAKRVVVHYIIAKGTIDEIILKVLRGKERTQNALFEALKQIGEATPESPCQGTGSPYPHLVDTTGGVGGGTQ